MENVNELGPAIVEWRHDMTYVENVVLTFMSADEASKDRLSALLSSFSACVDFTQYVEICLKYKKKVKIKRIPFFRSFVDEIKHPVRSTLFIRTQLPSEVNKKLNCMIVKPVQVLGKKKNKEFYFGGLAYWNLITMK